MVAYVTASDFPSGIHATLPIAVEGGLEMLFCSPVFGSIETIATVLPPLLT
jgi:hypothetical protein